MPVEPVPVEPVPVEPVPVEPVPVAPAPDAPVDVGVGRTDKSVVVGRVWLAVGVGGVSDPAVDVPFDASARITTPPFDDGGFVWVGGEAGIVSRSVATGVEGGSRTMMPGTVVVILRATFVVVVRGARVVVEGEVVGGLVAVTTTVV